MEKPLENIELIQFRNHRQLKVDFDDLTILTGPNGCGKTAVLEAVSLLSVATSWKTERDSELVQFGADFTRVVSTKREVVVQKSPASKRYRIDGIAKRLSEILGELPTVLFQPDDSELVHGSPAIRRAFLDRLLSQVEKDYAKQLSHYQKVLKQRNALLKLLQEGSGEMNQLHYWDHELALAGEEIRKSRLKTIVTLQETLDILAPEILPESVVTVVYSGSPATQKDFITYLHDHHGRDIAAGSTMGGPHRDDFDIYFNDHPAREVASRGQTRVIVFGLKMAELSIIRLYLEAQPILLLDDVFAEFDKIRRKKISTLFGNFQTIMTATEVPKELSGLVTEIAIQG